MSGLKKRTTGVQGAVQSAEKDDGKPGFWQVSPLSPPWTTAAVFVLIVFVTAAMTTLF